MYKVNVGEPLKKVVSDVKKFKEQNDFERVLSYLNNVTENPHDVITSMPKFDCDEVLLYVDADITVYYISTTPNILYPPHEHGMEAISALYKGTETHIFYDRVFDDDTETVTERSRVTFEAPAVVDMNMDVVHAICTSDDQPNEGLHFYFGDLEGQERKLWNIAGDNPRQYVHEDYLKSAREFE